MLQVDAAVLKRAKVMVSHTFLIRKKLLMISSCLNSTSHSGKPILEHHPLNCLLLHLFSSCHRSGAAWFSEGGTFDDRCLRQKLEAIACLQSPLLVELQQCTAVYRKAEPSGSRSTEAPCESDDNWLDPEHLPHNQERCAQMTEMGTGETSWTLEYCVPLGSAKTFKLYKMS